MARVYLVPAARSPLKNKGPVASPSDRAALIRSAIRGRPGISLGRWDLTRPGPSYTYPTLRRLERLFPRRRWELILGEDSWRQFRRWRRWRDIRDRVVLVVGRRAGGGPRGGPTGAVFLKKRIPAVSSTDIRRALSSGRPIHRWVSPDVALSIQKKGLYR